MRSLSVALLSVAVGLLAGCNPFSAPTDMMDEYVERVARVLDEDPHLSPIPVADLFPRRRERRLPMPELDLGMLDFLSLYGCELQVVVGERNSGLGRVMQPSNVLRYEVRFINAAEDCLPTLAEKKELQAAVRQARRSKIDSLPIAVWNATWATEEIERLFTRTEGVYPLDATGTTVDDLATDVNLMNARLSSLLAGRTDTDLGFLDNVQQRWQAEDRMGQLVKSALLLTTRLNDAADLVDRRLSDHPLCLNGKTNPDADIARNMFYAVYAERVQPYMASVDRARVDLVAGFAELAAMQQAVMPETFGPYYRRYLKQSGEQSIWVGLDTAVQRHTESWQRLLKQCGMTPGSG